MQLPPFRLAHALVQVLLEQVMPELVAGQPLPADAHCPLFAYQPVAVIQFLR
jgi:hypothetical protein